MKELSLAKERSLRKTELLIIAFALLCFSIPFGLLEIEYKEVSTGLALIGK